MPSFLKLLVGIAVIIAIGVVSAKTQILPGSLISAEHRLQRHADDALAAVEAPWASVRLDGQKAVLTGEAPTKEAMTETAAGIANAHWPGGLVLGGVTAVDLTDVKIYDGPPIVTPFRWSAERTGDNVVLTGYAPNEAARDVLYRYAVERFPDAIISGEQIEIAGGAPPVAAWVKAISTALQALTRLEHGAISAENTYIVITGVAASQKRMAHVDQLMSAMPEGFSGFADITLSAPPPQPDILRDTDIVTALREVCVSQFRTLISNQRIPFAAARIYINPESRAFLYEVADLLTQCPQIMLEVAGHADTSGIEVDNLRLSLQRADAVADFLRSIGANSAQMTTLGVGSKQPWRSNDTPEGRAYNRRVEFDITAEPAQE